MRRRTYERWVANSTQPHVRGASAVKREGTGGEGKHTHRVAGESVALGVVGCVSLAPCAVLQSWGLLPPARQARQRGEEKASQYFFGNFHNFLVLVHRGERGSLVALESTATTLSPFLRRLRYNGARIFLSVFPLFDSHSAALHNFQRDNTKCLFDICALLCVSDLGRG